MHVYHLGIMNNFSAPWILANINACSLHSPDMLQTLSGATPLTDTPNKIEFGLEQYNMQLTTPLRLRKCGYLLHKGKGDLL